MPMLKRERPDYGPGAFVVVLCFGPGAFVFVLFFGLGAFVFSPCFSGRLTMR